MGFASEKEKSIAFLYSFLILYVRCGLGKVLEECCCNDFRHFQGIKSGDNVGWCDVSAGEAVGATAGGAARRVTVRAAGAAAGAVADAAASGAAGAAAGAVAGVAADGVAGRSAGGAAGAAVGGVAGGVAGRAAGGAAGAAADAVAGAAAGGAAGGAAGAAVGAIAGGAAGAAAGAVAGGAVGGAASAAVSEAAGRATGGGSILSTWTDKTIISTIVLAYVSRLEKQSIQPGSSSFCSSSTDVIRIATFASRCFQAIENLRLAIPLSGQVCNL